MYQEHSVLISERCRKLLVKLGRQWGSLTYGQTIERLVIEQETREQLQEHASRISVREDGIIEIVRRLRDVPDSVDPPGC